MTNSEVKKIEEVQKGQVKWLLELKGMEHEVIGLKNLETRRKGEDHC